MTLVMRFVIVIAVLAAGCGKFEDPAIVIDLRPLAMTANPVEQLIPYDPQHPPDPSTIQLAPVTICALVADPGATRQLEYTMTACPESNDDRCPTDEPSFVIGGGTFDDPEDADAPQIPCAQLDPGPSLFAVIHQAVVDDPLKGFDSIDIQVVMSVNAPGATPDQQVWASKAVRFGAQVPADRTPNHNPSVDEIDWLRADTTTGPLTLGRCHDQAAPLEVAAGEQIHLAPVETPGARETYAVPTFDGGEQHITENLSYDWYAGAGKWDSAHTAGPRDPFGNDPPLDTSWTAPAADEIGGGLDVPIYIVQRDERLGEAWYESCVHVHP